MSYFRKNEASHKQIEEHFKGCKFEPPLESYIDVSPYIDKILAHAERFEYWTENELVGLAAVYCNDFKSRESFLTMLSVMKKYSKHGIGTELLKQSISYCKDLGFEKMKLEVLAGNEKAIKVYNKFGFKEFGRNDKFIKMELKL